MLGSQSLRYKGFIGKVFENKDLAVEIWRHADMSSAVQNQDAGLPQVIRVRRFRLIRLGRDVHCAYFLRS